MAKLRPITNQALTDVKYDIKSRDITIKDGQQYVVAAFYFHKCKDILYFNYWSDASLAEGNVMMDYSITKEDVEWCEKNSNFFTDEVKETER